LESQADLDAANDELLEQQQETDRLMEDAAASAEAAIIQAEEDA